MTNRSGTPSSSRMRSTSSWASRSWITSVLPSRLAMSICRRKDSCCAGRPVLVRCGSSPARSPRRRAPGRWTRRATRSRRAPRRGGPARARPRRLVGVQRDARRRARRGWSRGLDGPAGARAGRSRSARSASRRPMRRASIASAVDSQAPSGPSAMSRWQWLSTTGCGSGSGSGGRLRSRSPSSCRLRVGRGHDAPPPTRSACAWRRRRRRTPPASARRPGRATSGIASLRGHAGRLGLRDHCAASAAAVRRVRRPRRRRPRDDDRDLAADTVGGPRGEVGQPRPSYLFVGLGQLAAHGRAAVGAERLGHRRQRRPRCGAAPRRRPSSARSSRRPASRRPRSPALRGRKPSKQNRSTGSPETASAASTADGPGTVVTVDVALDGRRDQPEARVGHRRHPGVGDQQRPARRLERLDERRRAGGLVALEVGHHPARGRHAEVGAQPPQPAGVLGGHHVGRGELLARAAATRRRPGRSASRRAPAHRPDASPSSHVAIIVSRRDHRSRRRVTPHHGVRTVAA